MRGEEGSLLFFALKYAELPPHARRRGKMGSRAIAATGITSACAEKSRAGLQFPVIAWNYLRMRGEESPGTRTPTGSKELPPHARRRVMWERNGDEFLGITSACAEKRQQDIQSHIYHWNYLRMRGEESSFTKKLPTRLELPPHARRRALGDVFQCHISGITSACAEKRYAGAYGVSRH